MHPSSYEGMKAAIQKHLSDLLLRPCSVLDVGSRQVTDSGMQATYRTLMPKLWRYTGCDMEAGVNVDVVMKEPYRLPGAPGSWDVILSGQCFEHVEWPWKLFAEVVKRLVPGGRFIITAPWSFPIHRYPVDCFRYLPDGWRGLCRWAGVSCLATWVEGKDSWVVGRKDQ